MIIYLTQDRCLSLPVNSAGGALLSRSIYRLRQVDNHQLINAIKLFRLYE